MVLESENEEGGELTARHDKEIMKQTDSIKSFSIKEESKCGQETKC
jgi:hypothetical protein